MPTVSSTLKVIEGISGVYGTGANNNTPVALAQEMINKLDVDWSNPNLTVLDPACGYGTFLIIAYGKLREHGHSPKHIVEKMLFGNDIDYKKAKIAASLLSKLAQNNTAIYNEDALSGVFDDMKFDVIVGNPPYQDITNKAKNNKLWHKFVQNVDYLNEGGVIAFVNPVSMFSYIGASERILKKYTTDMSIAYVKTHDTMQKNPFPTVSVDTCHWIAVNKPYDGKTEYNGKMIDLRNKNELLSEEQIRIDAILKKIEDYRPKIEFSYQGIDNQEGQYEYLYSGKKKCKSVSMPINEGRLKYVVSFSASYKNQFTTTENVAGFNRYILIKEGEDKQIESFMLSNVIKFFAMKYRKTAGFTPAVKNNMIPDLRRKELWTNEELYKLFELSQEDINLVEQHVR